jgi:hypothetical protein
MSSYWDAVSRAALGLPGLAEPRPRSMFEPDEIHATRDDFEAIEQEVDATPIRPASTPARRPPPSPESIAGHPGQAKATAQSPGLPPPSQPGDAAHERLDTRAEVRAPQTDSSATHDDRVKPSAPLPPSEAVAQIEVHRIETMRTTIEPVETREPPAGAEVAAWKPVAQERAPHRDTPAEPAEAAVIEPPSVIVAEPLAPSPAPAPQQLTPDPPPLVIEIGRIDIRIASETAAPPVAPKSQDASTVPSLNDYLARRSEAKR